MPPAWSAETRLSVHAGLRTSLAFDAHGDAHVSLQEPGGALVYLRHAAGIQWEITALDGLHEAAWGASLALDANGAPLICYSDLGEHALRCASPAHREVARAP
jgi:hypothetical protein